jgi:hypothetical protein
MLVVSTTFPAGEVVEEAVAKMVKTPGVKN